MRKFEYRRPRYPTDIAIVIHLASTYSIRGRCTDISAEGLGVRVFEELTIGVLVAVEFSFDGYPVRTNARVEYCHDSNYYGLSFQFSSALERDSVKQIMHSVHKIK
jgi:hypothetical protein